MRRPQFQFRLLTLLIAVPILGALLGLLRREMVGRVELPIIHHSSGSSPQVSLVFASATDAQSAIDRFGNDRDAIIRAAETRLQNDVERDLLLPFDYMLTLVTPKPATMIAVKYDVPRWSRRQFSLREWRYVTDAEDPVATRRNNALEDALTDAIAAWAREKWPNVAIEVHGWPRATSPAGARVAY